MKQTSRFLATLICVFSLFFISGCETGTPEDDNTVGDETFYTGLGASMVNCYHDIYNQNLAGKPTGIQSKTVTGPMGGSALITGTTSLDGSHDITTVDLVFNLTNVKYTYSYGGESGKDVVSEITLTGSTTYVGTFSSSYTSLNHHANNIHVVGSVTYKGVTRNIDQTGSVVINRSGNITVNIFGHTVSW